MKISRRQHRRFLLLWLIALPIFLLFTAVVNYLVDPYGLFDTPRIAGFNSIKPAAESHVRLAKPYQVDSFSPRTVIIGNSRPQMGLAPDNECWPAKQRPVYNLALPGATTYMQARLVQHAVVGDNTEFVLWGLDFLDFLGTHASASVPQYCPSRREKFEERLRVNSNGSMNRDYSWNRLKDEVKTLFSLDTVRDTLDTLFAQKDRHASSIRRDGFNPALEYIDIIGREGQGIIFKQKNIAVATILSRSEMTLFQGESKWSREFEAVRRQLLFAQKRKVEVTLFISPYHADYLALLEMAGWWPQFESWKRQLTMLSTEFGVELWDFSGINPLSTEQPPALGDKRTILKWFWESVHYRREYGDLMLSKMLQRSCSQGGNKPVGVLLIAENIDSHLNHLQNDIAKYKEEHKEALKRLSLLDSNTTTY